MTAWDLMPVTDYHCLTLPQAIRHHGDDTRCPLALWVLLAGVLRSCGSAASNMLLMRWSSSSGSTGFEEIVFFDETFTIGRRRMRKFAEEVQRRGLTVKFNIRARVDTIDREVVRALKAAGLRSIHMGVEAGTDRVLKIMNKQISREQTRACLPNLSGRGRRYPRILHDRLLRRDTRGRGRHDQVRGRARPGLGELLRCDRASRHRTSTESPTSVATSTKISGVSTPSTAAGTSPARDRDLHGRAAARLSNKGVHEVLSPTRPHPS